MFSALDKYSNRGNFQYKAGDNFIEISKSLPNLPGIFYIFRLAMGKIEIVYISKTDYTGLKVREKIRALGADIKWKHLIDRKFLSERIDALDIYWAVTDDGENNDSPREIETTLLLSYKEVHGKFPIWNR